MLVESHDEFDLVGEFDPVAGTLTPIARDDAGSLLEQPLRGHFAKLDEQVAILYRHEGKIKFRLGDLQIEPSGTKRVQWDSMGSMAEIKIISNEQVQTSAKYRCAPDVGPGIEEDPTPFIDAEDWDFGLFVRNVLTDDERAARIYRY